MKPKTLKTHAVPAIVRFPKAGGRGVLVGEFILTAAHCIDVRKTGGMALGDYSIEEMQTCRGIIRGTVLAVEPVSDIAILGALDNFAFYHDAVVFDKFCARTRPVKISRDKIKLDQALAVRILDRDDAWVDGVARLSDGGSCSLAIDADKEIKTGASGGPILNQQGELVAIVSNFSIASPGKKSRGCCPMPLQALPVWVCQMLSKTSNH